MVLQIRWQPAGRCSRRSSGCDLVVRMRPVSAHLTRSGFRVERQWGHSHGRLGARWFAAMWTLGVKLVFYNHSLGDLSPNTHELEGHRFAGWRWQVNPIAVIRLEGLAQVLAHLILLLLDYMVTRRVLQRRLHLNLPRVIETGSGRVR